MYNLQITINNLQITINNLQITISSLTVRKSLAAATRDPSFSLTSFCPSHEPQAAQGIVTCDSALKQAIG
jgi:hypothetical protein